MIFLIYNAINDIKIEGVILASFTVRNLSDEIHRALRVRAAMNGRSTEAEIRLILESAVRPESRIKLGTFLSENSREVGGFNIDTVRDKTPSEPVSFE